MRSTVYLSLTAEVRSHTRIPDGFTDVYVCVAYGYAYASENARSCEALLGLGVPPNGPTLIGTDNLANQKVGSGDGSPTRSRHFLRRYYALQQRIAQDQEEVTLHYQRTRREHASRLPRS